MLALILVVSGFLSNFSIAQNVFNYSGAGTQCAQGLNTFSLVENGHSINPARSAINYASPGNKIPEYIKTMIYALDESGVQTDITMQCYGKAGENGICLSDFTPGTKQLLNYAFGLYAIPEAYYGKTIRVELHFGKNGVSQIKEQFDFDVVGSQTTINASTAHTFDTSYTDFTDYLCYGDEINVEIGNEDYPFGTSESYKGNKYFAKYSWRLSEMDYYTTVEIANYGVVGTDTKSYSNNALALGTQSRLWAVMPFVDYYYTDATGTKVCSSTYQMSPSFQFYYEAPVETSIQLNGSSASSITICDGDDVQVDFQFTKDGFDYFDVWVGLYSVDGGGVETLVWENDYLDNMDDFYYVLQNLLVTSKKDTQYNYRLKVKDITNKYADNNPSACESPSVDFTVLVLEKDATVTLSSTGNHCENEDVVVTMESVATSGTVANYTYQLRRKEQGASDATAIDIATNDGGNKTHFTVTDASVPAGDYTYLMYISNKGECEYLAGQVDVTVNVNPTGATTDDEICLNQVATISVEVSNVAQQPTGSTYTYLWSTGATGDGASLPTSSATCTPTSTTDYTVKITNNLTGCSSIDPQPQATVVVNPLPDIDKINGPTAACLNATVDYTAVLKSSYSPKSEPITYTWKKTPTTAEGTAQTVTNTTGKWSFTLDAPYKVTVTAKDAKSCDSGTAGEIVTIVNPLPDFAPSCAPTCSGSVATILMNNADARVLTYTFTAITAGAPAITGSTADSYTVTTPSVSVVTDYEYSVLAEDDLGCQSTQQFTMRVNPLPTITSATVDKAKQCLGQPIKLSVAANSNITNKTLTYEWFEDGVTIPSSNTKTLTYTPTTSGDHVYTVVVKDVNGCEASEDVNVTIYEIATVTAQADPEAICVGETSEIKAILSSGSASDYSFKWSNNKTTQDIVVNPTTTTSYTVTVTQNATGCKVVSNAAEVAVNKLPEFTITFDPDEVCEGVVTSVTMKMVSAGSATISSYTYVSGGDDFTASGTLGEYNSKAGKSWSANTTYTYKATSDKGCISLPVAGTLKVSPKPATPSFAISPTEICAGDATTEVKLTVDSPKSGMTYYWYEGATQIGVGTTHKLATNPSSTTVYSVKAVSAFGCESDLGNNTLVVHPLPTVTITGTDIICLNEETVLTANPVAGDGGTFAANGYTWYADGVVISGKTTQSITVKPTVTTVYTVKVSESTKCEAVSADYTVTVNKLPTFTMKFSEEYVCAENPTELHILMTPIAGSPVITGYAYVSGGDIFTTEVSLGDYKTSATQTWSSNQTYCYTATTADGCYSSTPVCATLEVKPKPATPIVTLDPAVVCEGSTDPITATISNYEAGLTYEVFKGTEITPFATITTGKTFQITDIPSVDTSYRIMSHSSSGCYSDEGTFTLSIVALPTTPIVTADRDAFCKNDADHDVVLTISNYDASLTYNWYIEGQSASVATGNNVTVSPNDSKSYYVVATNSTGCKSLKSNVIDVVVTVNPVITAIGDTEIYLCPGSVATADVAVSTTDINPVGTGDLIYTWTLDGVSVAAASVDVTTTGSVCHLDLTSAAEGLHVVKVSATYGTALSPGCATEELTFNITIRPVPVLDFTIAGVTWTEGVVVDVCEEDICDLVFTNLTGTMGYTLKNSSDVEITTSSLPTSTSDTYTLLPYQTYGGTTCYGDVQTFKVNVNKRAVFTVDGSTTACADGDIILSSTITNSAEIVVASYQWYKDGVEIAGATSDTFTKSSATSADGGVYKLRITTDKNCYTEQSVTVVVNELPAISWVDNNLYTAPGQYVCLNGSEALIEIKSADGDNTKIVNTLWDINTLHFGSVNENLKVAVMALTPDQSHDELIAIKAYAIDVNGCQSPAITGYVTVKEIPELIDLVVDQTPCENEQIQVSVKTKLAGNYTYVLEKDGSVVGSDWSSVTTGNETTWTGPLATAADNGNYTVKVIDNDTKCESQPNAYSSFTIGVEKLELTIDPAEKRMCFNAMSDVTLALTVNSIISDHSSFVYNITIYDKDNNPIYTDVKTGIDTYDINKSIFTSIGNYKVEINVDNGVCTAKNSADIIVLDSPVPIPVVDGLLASVITGVDFEVCSDQPLTIVTTGADKYEITNIERDGVDVTSQFSGLTYTGTEFRYEITSGLTYDATTAGAKDYSDYKFSFVSYIADCDAAAELNVRVYALPVSTLDISPRKLVIENQAMVLTVLGADYSNYEFIINGVSKQSGPSKTYSFNATEDADIKVIVTNYHGCSIELTDAIQIMEGVEDKAVRVSSPTYCSEPGDGVTVYIEDPQEGITYELNECASCAPIKAVKDANGDIIVEWKNVKVYSGSADNTTTSVSDIFSVTAYHESLHAFGNENDIVLTLKPTITEVYSSVATAETLDKIGTTDTCGEPLSVENTVVGYHYYLMRNGSLFDPLVQVGNGGTITFNEHLNSYGIYTVVRYSVFGAEELCEVELPAKYEIVEPNEPKFDVLGDGVKADYAGNYCKDSQPQGVRISLSGSKSGQDYNLYLNDISTVVKTVTGDGNAIDFGEYSTEGLYLVGYDYNGCNFLMDNTISVKGYDAPKSDDFAVEVHHNGVYKEGDDVKIHVISSEKRDYYRYELVNLSTGEVNKSFVGLDEIEYIVKTSEPYDFRVVNTKTENKDNDCSLVLKSVGLDITSNLNPNPMCYGENVVLSIQSASPEAKYTISELGSVVVDVDGNAITDKTTATGTLEFTIGGLAVGDHTFDIVSTRTTTYEYREYVATKLSVVERPNIGVTEVVEFNVEPTGVEECYGKDIVIKNSRNGYTYSLYKVEIDKINPDFTIEFKVDGYGNYVYGPAYDGDMKTSIEGNGGEVRFVNIKDKNGKYQVRVSNGYCEDILANGDITGVFARQITPYLTTDVVCEGDGGTQIFLPVYETDIIYVVRDSNGREVARSAVDDPTRVPGGALTFSKVFTKGDTYGVYGIASNNCETPMGSLTFTVNDLPISFELGGTSIYCGESTDIQLELENSEEGVTYTLYVMDDEGDFVEYVDEYGNTLQVTGTAADEVVYFPHATVPQRYLESGRYQVIARNTITGCTSSMKNQVTVEKRSAISSFKLDNNHYASCQGNVESVVLSASDLVVGATYYMYHSTDTIEVENVANDAALIEDKFVNESVNVQALKANGGALEFKPFEVGKYVIVAAYDNFACPITIDTFDFEIHNLDMYQFSAAALCGGEIEYMLNGSQSGVKYVVYSLDTASVSVPVEMRTFDGTGEAISFTVPNDASVVGATKVYVNAVLGGCELQMKGEVDPATLVIPALDKIDVTFNGNICQSGRFNYKSDIFQPGFTYYFMIDDSSSSPEIKPAMFVRKANAEGVIEAELPEGVYTVWASYDEYKTYDCLDVMNGVITITKAEFTKFVLTYGTACEIGKASVKLSGSQVDYKYILTGSDGYLQEKIGDGSSLVWDVAGTGIASYSLTVVSASGECSDVYDSISVDFTTVTKANGKMTMFVEGEEVPHDDVPSVCSSSLVTLSADITGVDKVKDIVYKFYLVDSETTMQAEHKRGKNPLDVMSLSGWKPGNYEIVLSVDRGECGVADSLDIIKFMIKGSASESLNFLPDDSHKKENCTLEGHGLGIHGEYCANEDGVALFYKGAMAGNIYRLFERMVDENGREYFEMVDMQEIPKYSHMASVDSLWFTGWGANSSDVDHKAKLGTYFVEIEEEDGCVVTTNDLTIYENPLPVDTVSTSPTYNQVLYAVINNDGETPNFDVTASEYGVVDAGFIIVTNPLPGMVYELVHVDSEVQPNHVLDHVIYDPNVSKVDWIQWGPIKSDIEYVEKGWGQGLYEVIAINPETNCQESVGTIDFVDEELVAYDVYLFINQNQNSVSQLLYPQIERFGNHKYIDWSKKVDVVWAPEIVTDSIDYSQYINYEAEEYPRKSGYTRNEKDANIMFELIQTMKDTVVCSDHDITEKEYLALQEQTEIETHRRLQERLESYYHYQSYIDETTNETVRDSLLTGQILISYDERGKESERKYIGTENENTPPTGELGDVIEKHIYWKTSCETIQVVDNSTVYGDFGFDPDLVVNLDNQVLERESKSGMFRYTKMPSFFGQVVLTYRIYNTLMPSVRFSNTANITILCGNQSMPDGNSVFLVPNAFSPNGDGLNEDFKIVLPHGYENSEVILEVFNRWGTRVYKSSGVHYGVDCPYWDGNSSTSNMVTVGNKLPSGTYYYVLSIRVNNISTGNSDKIELKGYVELRR